MFPAARIGDMHMCPMVTPGVPPVPHVGGPITGPGVATVLIGGMPAATLGDMCTCVGPPDIIAKGSAVVLIGGKPAARVTDVTAHGGMIAMGCPTVLIGDAGSAGGGGGAGAATAAATADAGAASTVAAAVAAAAAGQEPEPVEQPDPSQVGPIEPEEEPQEMTWIGIRLRDQDGNPLPDQDFQVTLEGGQTLSGTTDSDGYARFDDIDPDQGEIDFINIPDEEELGSTAEAQGRESILTVSLADPSLPEDASIDWEPPIVPEMEDGGSTR